MGVDIELVRSIDTLIKRKEKICGDLSLREVKKEWNDLKSWYLSGKSNAKFVGCKIRMLHERLEKTTCQELEKFREYRVHYGSQFTPTNAEVRQALDKIKKE